MRTDARFVVKRLAPMIGRPASVRRVSVDTSTYTLADALEAAQGPTRRRQVLEGIRSKAGAAGPAWLSPKILELSRTATWIEARGAPATLARKLQGGGGGGG